MTTQTASKPRPLSPYLQVYKPQISTTMSILHRLTGIGLALGLPIFIAWLVIVAAGQEPYDSFIQPFQTALGQILLFGWTWAFFYHFCCGIRHLLWDAGYFLTIKGLYSTGYVALGVSTVLTLGVWLKAYGYLP